MRSLWLALPLAAVTPPCVQAQTVLFFEDFNGPPLNSAFQALLPNGAPLANGDGSCTYLGAPNASFGTLGGASVLRLTNTLNDWQRVGWSTNTVLTATDFRAEVRFNSLVQSPTTSIDSFIEAWVIDANNPGRYDFASPHGQNYGTNRQFRAGSSITGQYYNDATGYQDNTWYRLVIERAGGPNVRASLLDDNGVELGGRTFTHAAGDFDGGFRIGLSQAMGAPGGPYLTDVAIDYVVVTTPVPEPSSVLLIGFAAAGMWAASRARKR